MVQLVNDRRASLETLCETGLLGQRTCSESDYQSWRRIAVSVRETLLRGDYAGHEALFSKVLSWLGDWVEPLHEIGAIAHAVAAGKAKSQADPKLDRDDLRYPAEVYFWQGGWDPSGVVYNEITGNLAAYIAEGYQLFKQGLKDGAIDPAKVSTALKRAEDRDPPKQLPVWAKWAIGVPLVAGTLALGTWIYATIRGAGRPTQ